MQRSCVVLIVSSICCLFIIPEAGSEVVGLDPIVVTPSRYSQSIYNVAGSIEILTEEDLEASNIRTVLDAMRLMPGIVVRDYFGNTVASSIDVRGFGEQAAMNSLVLVDGRRLNEVDLSGVDWTQIPLEQVARIEFLRGGSGSVLYGDNAVAGVVNIITKKGDGKPKIEADVEYGSYDMNAQRLSIGASQDSFSYRFSASRGSTHGYRDNSYLRNENISSRLDYDMPEGFGVSLSVGLNNNNYGMPGALYRSDVDSFGRQHTKFSEDYSKNRSYYIHARIRKYFNSTADLLLDFTYKNKDSYSSFIGASPAWNPFVKSNIRTYGFAPKLTLSGVVFDIENKLIAGVDMYWHNNSSDTYDISDTLADYTRIKKFTTGFYLHDEISLTENVKITGGYRYETARYRFDDKSSTSLKKTRPNQEAYSIGASYNYADFSNLFFNLNKSFRFPATDEYFTWGSLDPDLKTQTSNNYEAGINHRFNENLNAGMSLFLMNLKNELYYNPTGGGNENYDKTRRQGLEASFDYKITPNIEFKGGYSYVKSYFKDGDYKDKNLPMVPQHKVNLNSGFRISEKLKLNIEGSFVDSRYFINDQNNKFKKLGSYFTLDTNISYSHNDLFLTAGVNNILAGKYSEYGVCNASGDKTYYPSPERNFTLKIAYIF
jgi:iron complex outermembrane recepter protein